MSDRKHYRTACTQKHIQKAGMGMVKEITGFPTSSGQRAALPSRRVH